MSEDWNDISTAPSSGGFLVYKPSNKKYKILTAYVDSTVSYRRIMQANGNTINEATHWMPLPKEPFNKTQGE